MKIFISEGPNAGRELDVEGSGAIGRDPDAASIVLDDPEASRRHVSISARGSQLVVEDLGSTNGTFVNGERIEGSRTVEAGDKLRIGTTVLEVRSEVAATRVSPIPEPVDYDATAVGERIPAPVAGGSPEQPPEGEGGAPPPPPGEGAGAPPPPPPPAAAPPPTPQPGYAPPQGGGPDYGQPGGAIAQPGYPGQGPMKTRDSVVEWLLCYFVPFYSLVWIHRSNKELQAWSGGR